MYTWLWLVRSSVCDALMDKRSDDAFQMKRKHSWCRDAQIIHTKLGLRVEQSRLNNFMFVFSKYFAVKLMHSYSSLRPFPVSPPGPYLETLPALQRSPPLLLLIPTPPSLHLHRRVLTSDWNLPPECLYCIVTDILQTCNATITAVWYFPTFACVYQYDLHGQYLGQ